MKKFLKGVVIGLVSFVALEASAQCYWSDVTGEFDAQCNLTSVKKGGKEATGADRERIMDKFEQMLAEKNGDCGAGGSFGTCAAEEGGEGSGTVEKVRAEIMKMMLVDPKTVVDSEKKKYQDNINSVRENQDKIKLNAVTRAIALGRRSVALALKSGEDIDALREEIETSGDMISLLKGIAKLQAQHLQKTNQITAMRSKILELNSIDAIISGDIYMNQGTFSESGSETDGTIE